jgi:hypothetical protein
MVDGGSARRMGVRETIVRRILDPDTATKTAPIENALSLVGKRLLIAMEDIEDAA